MKYCMQIAEDYKVLYRNKVFVVIMRTGLIASIFIVANGGNNPNVRGLIMDKQKVVYPYDGILSHEREWSTDGYRLQCGCSSEMLC